MKERFEQFRTMKAKHPDAILLFREGTCYECYGSDAVAISSLLGVRLAMCNMGNVSPTQYAGFAHHSLDKYLPELVRAGYRVAICEQLVDPKKEAK